MILSWIRAFMDWVTLTFTIVFSRLKNTIIKISIVTSILVLLIWISAFLYGSFYYLYMPSLSHVRHIHFKRDCERVDENLCSFPRANISLLSAYDDQLLKVGQVYRIFVEIDLPESPVNQNLGVFVVHIKLFHNGVNLVREASRSAMLHYKSSLLQSLETYFFSPLLVFGVKEQKQKLKVELFSKYVEDAYKPADRAYIELQSKNIQYYDTDLYIHAHFTGLRFIMFQFPILSAFGGISSNLLFLSMIVLFSWYQFFIPSDSERSVIVKVGSRSKTSLEDRRKTLREKMERERTLSTASLQSLSSMPSKSVLNDEIEEEIPVTLSHGSNDISNQDDQDAIFVLAPKESEDQNEKIDHLIVQSNPEEMKVRHRKDDL